MLNAREVSAKLLAGLGMVCALAVGAGAQTAQFSAAGNFGSVAMGQTSPALTLTATFQAAETIAVPQALMMGAGGLDYAVSGGSCKAGQSYAVGGTCTVAVTFAPQGAGPRNGAVVLEDQAGNTLATAYLQGTGTGPVAGFQVQAGSMLSFPGDVIFPERAVAVDGAGDIFVGSANQGPTAFGDVVQEVPAGCVQAACVKTLPGKHDGIWGLAVDGAGNVFVADVSQAGQITEIPASGGYSTAKVLTGKFGSVQSVAVDGTGNVFLTDFTSGSVMEMTAASGYATATVVANGFLRPGGIAVDSSEDVFFTDGANVKEIVAVNGVIPATPTIKVLGSGFGDPVDLALDGSGDVYVTDGNVNHDGLYEIVAAGGYTTVNQVANGFTAPSGVAIDSASNLYVVDSYANDGFGLGGYFLNILPRAQAPGIAFPTPAPPGSTESGGFTDILTNLGTSPLNLSALTMSSKDFSLDAGTTTCTASTVLAPGATCVLGLDFTPQAVGGSINGTLTVTDNSGNAAGSTQQIALNGQALYSPVVTVTSAPNIALAQTLTVTVTVAPAGGNPVPTGSVQLFAGPYMSGIVPLVNGSATFNIPATNLVPGAIPQGAGVLANITMAGNYIPDAPATAFYAESRGLAAVTVTSTALIIPSMSLSSPALTIDWNQPLTLTMTVSGGSGNPTPTGSVTLTSGAYTSAPATLVNGSAAITIPGGTLPVGVNAIFGTYVPDAASSNTYLTANGSSWITVTAPPPPVSPVTPGLGNAAIGQTSAPTTVTLTFGATTTIGSITAMTQGAPGLDFAIVPGGTCKVGATYNAGQSCTVNVTFTPTAAGLRNGGVVVQDASGNLQAQAYVHGTGTGPQMIFLGEPYYYGGFGATTNYAFSTTTIGGGFNHPGIAVDGAGNVFVADEGNGAIKEIPAGCSQDSCQKVVMSGLGAPWAVAVDGAGNLFVADLGPDVVFEIPIGCQTTSCLQNIGSGYSEPYGLALDSAGNVFVADGGNGAIKEVLAAGGYTTVNTLVSGLDLPWSVVVDANENLFVGEGGDQCQVFIPGSCTTINTQVVEIPAANDYAQTVVLGSGVFGKPMGLAIDGSGNVFVGDFGDLCPFEFLEGTGYTVASRLCPTTFFESPESVAVEGNGNLIYPNVLYGGVERLDFVDPPALTYRYPAEVGEPDISDGDQYFAVQNQGNAPLTFTSITVSDPSFQIDSTTTNCLASKPLTPGQNCFVGVFFQPTSTGVHNATLTLTDNNMGQNGSTQVVKLMADSLAPAPTILTMPANPTGVNSATFTFSDTQANVTFECSIDGLPFSTCVSGIVYSPLAAGQHNFQVKALDADNNLGPSAVYNWTITGVAVTPPTITSGPGHITSATGATFGFTDTENGVTFLCSLDGVAFTACTSGVSYANLEPTKASNVISLIHSFAVEAKDGGGNISQPTSYTFTVTVDTIDTVSTDFGAVPVGQTSAAQTVTFAFAQFQLIPAGGDSIATIDATTLGITGLDYAVSNPGTCAVGTAITAASTCSMQVTFKPQHAGQRKGAIILLDPAGNGIGEAYLNGTGTGPQVTFTPYTPVNYTILPPQNNANPGKDLQTLATDSTVDGAGNVYVMDDLISTVDGTIAQSTGDVWEFAPGCTTAACNKLFVTSNGSSNPLELDLATGIAMDGAGTVWAGSVFLGSGQLSTVGKWTSQDCGFIWNFLREWEQPAVDGWGGVYYIGSGALSICGNQLGTLGTAARPVKGRLPKASATKAKPEGGNANSFNFSGSASSLAVDPQGNIWVADTGNNAVKEVLASSGFQIAQTVGSGFSNPESVASDAFGNIFVNDAGNGAIKEMTASSGYTTILTVASTPVNTTFFNDNIKVDALGNLYVPNQTPSGYLGVIQKLDFADAPALMFATPTKVATQDTTDGTLTATVNNSGNAPLTISGLAITGNSFQIDSSATTCSAQTTLAVGGSCTVGVFYSPTAVGEQTGTLTITDDALNTNGATQTFALSGTGFINPTTSTPTVTVSPAANSINTSQTLSVTVTVAGKNPTPVPTGVVTLSSGTYNSATTALTGGTATITIPAGLLAAGSDTLTAIYAPDQAASATYNDGAGFASVTVTAVAKTTPTVTVTPSPATVTLAQDFSVMVTAAGGAGNPTPSGTVTLLSGGFSSGQVVLSNGSATIPVPARTLAAGTDALTVNYAPDAAGSANYNNAAGTATETVQPIAKTAPGVKVTPSPNQVLTNQALTVTVALSGGLGNPSPTGTVTLSGGGFTSAAITLNGGSAAIPIPAGALSMGTDTLTATYAPDVAGGETYTNATGANTVTVSAAGISTGNFGTIPVGQTSAAQTLTFTFAGTGTIGSLAAMMQGAPALDFAVVNVGTCTAGATFSAGSTCTANVVFSPTLAGTRYGAVIVKDGAGNTVATDLVNGIGSGPQVRLVPSLPRVNPAWPTVGAIPAASTVPSGVVDGIGDVFFLEGSQQATVSVMEIPAGCTTAACVKTLPTNATIPGEPFSLALDLSGNIFVTAGTGNVGQIGAIWEITAASGYQTTTKLPVTFGEGDLTGIVLDQSGNIFVAISSALQNAALGLYEVSAAGGYSTATPIASALTNPYALAIDMSGNLFVSGGTATSTGVYEVLAAGGYTTVNLLGNGFSYPGAGEFTLPLQLSTDQGGDVFFIDGATFNSVDEILASGGYQTVDSIPSAFSGSSIDPDASGNLYLFVGNSIDKLEFNDAYVNFFAATLEGTTDTTDAPHWVTVQNIGNAPLNLTAITPPNANFIIDNSTTTCSISTPIAAGGSCVVGMDFVPGAVGALTGTLTLTDNSLNVSAATQAVYLSGTGTGVPTVTVTPSPASISTAQALTVTVTVSGTPTPTGSVTLTSGTYSSAQ